MPSKPLIAVIGANGFIGSRLVESLQSSHDYGVRAITRRPCGVAGDVRIADAFDMGALAEALSGCTFVVHCVAGDRATIVDTAVSAYHAAERAGCRRLIYLSSAVVHGHAPEPGTSEQSPLSHDQPIDYSVSKILAEEALTRLRSQGAVELVILRPGIVYGPRSQWTDGLAHEIAEGRAYLVDEGAGLCNAIHVDNLIKAILLACEAADADGEAYLLGETGTISWQEFYARTAMAIGRDAGDIPSVEFEGSPALDERVAAADWIPRPIRKRLARALTPSKPRPTLEMALLHRSRHVPSWAKAREQLGYQPPIAADEAWQQTQQWLATSWRRSGGADASV